jgi:RimJ/RimL family protein N-acetyltransferase
MRTLSTVRLTLRPFRRSDWDDVHAYAADPDVVRYLDWGPNGPADTTAHLDEVVADSPTRLPYAIERRTDGRVVGSAELVIDSLTHRRAQMGYVLARDAWGQGYATEAAAAVLRFGLHDAGLRRVSATCDPDNTGSARVLEKIGMAYEGRLHSFFLIRGEWRDRLLFAAVRD